MSALQFNLHFAGIPLLNDNSVAYRFSRLQGEAEGRSPVRQQQSEQFLWDEIERLIPTEYLRDFDYQQEYPGRNTGSLARNSQMKPETKVRLGDFFYPTNASRWSYFRGLASSSQVKAMLAHTEGNKPKTFTISSEPISQGIKGKTYGVSTELYMLPARPLGEIAGTFDGLYLVTLVDERYFWFQNPQTQHLDFTTTWTQLVNQIANALNIEIDLSAIPDSYLSPEPDSHLWVNQEDTALLLDCIAYNVGRVVVRDYDGVYSLLTPEESLSIARSNRIDDNGIVIRQAGGDCFASGTALPVGTLQKQRNIAPTAVRVTFPKYVTELPVPHFAEFRGDWSRWFLDSYNGTYAIDTPITSGGSYMSGLSGSPYLSGLGVSGNGIHTIYNTAKALYSNDLAANSGTPNNVSGLTALANQITRDYYQQNAVDGLDEVYLGILNWEPEGLHDILFRWSARERIANTRVIRSEFNLAIRNMQHCTPAVGGGVGYPWVPGMVVLSGYTISDQGTNSYIDIDISNINITSPNFTWNISTGSTFDLNIEEDSTLQITGWTTNDILVSLSVLQTDVFILLTALNPENPIAISTLNNPENPIVVILVTEAPTPTLTFQLVPETQVTLTSSETPDDPIVSLFVVESPPLGPAISLTIEENSFLSIMNNDKNVHITTFTIDNTKIIQTFDPTGSYSIADNDDPTVIFTTFSVINNENRLLQTFENNAIYSISNGDAPNDYLVSFFVVDNSYRSLINSGFIWNIIGDGDFWVSSFFVIDGPVEKMDEEEDEVVTDQTALFVVEDKPIVKIPVNADIDVFGILKPTNNRQLTHTLFNTGSGTATIKNNDTLADSGNRIYTPGGADVTWNPQSALSIWYDATENKTRIINAGGTGSTDGFSGTKSVVTVVTCVAGTLSVTNETWYFQGGRFLSGG